MIAAYLKLETIMPSTAPIVQQDASLKYLNTFGINASAKYLATITSSTELSALLSQNIFQDMPKLMLGDGSNILFIQDYPGLIIKNAIKGIQVITTDDNHIWLKIGAGENWHAFVMHCIAQGYSGIENLSLIPGTVGAAPIQNIGAYGVELCDVFCELEAIHLTEGTLRTFTREECQFGYRDSVFKTLYKNQYAILAVTLRLNKTPNYQLSYGNIQETLQMMKVKDLSIKAVSDAVIHIRRSKLPDPHDLGNAGSFFKNPLIPIPQFSALQSVFPNIPSFPTENPEMKKISAAWLIEQCGWKGKRLGDVGVYEKQALILVNYKAGKGADILDLAQKIQASVNEKFNIKLTPEVNLI